MKGICDEHEKKLLFLVLLLTMRFFLAACGEEEPEEAVGKEAVRLSAETDLNHQSAYLSYSI